MGHTLNAQNIWNHRIAGKKPTQSTWETFDIDELSGLNDKNHAMSNVIVGQFDLRTLIDYKNSSGESFSNSVENILYHIINHSTYHRGQLMTELKQNGATPLSTDYIFYHRK
ncbi:MAG: damage-inducible protein DinB [Bacteroidetes bacterium]|nr:MAG: damage-inducible protein DinB [Bacteroidota bacterium]